MSYKSVNHIDILLIDDDEDDYVVLRDLFSDIRTIRYNIVLKRTYQDGLAELLTGRYDACLLDYMLGEKTGLELLHEAQKNRVRSPIILLTGHGDFELDVRAMQTGAADYLVKGQITSNMLERSIRYSMKHAFDMEELRKSQEQVLRQDRLASLGLLASSLAHEIGTPLGIIRGRAELLVNGNASADEVKENMSLVITQIDRISALVKSLLNLARGKQSEHAAAVNLSRVVQDIKNLMSHELERKSIAFEMGVEEGLLVRAESGPLAQVFLNLLVNSVYAIEEKNKDNPVDANKISIIAQRRGARVEIKVTDTGGGISVENIKKLFQPFFTTKDIGVGTGLGLATSYKLIQSWGGSIEVESKLNLGTSFTIILRAP